MDGHWMDGRMDRRAKVNLYSVQCIGQTMKTATWLTGVDVTIHERFSTD